MGTTRVSSKGQIVLPVAIRAARRWKAGTELTVEDRPEGVLLRPAKPFVKTKLSEVVGATGYKGPRRTLRQMEAAIEREARKRR